MHVRHHASRARIRGKGHRNARHWNPHYSRCTVRMMRRALRLKNPVVLLLLALLPPACDGDTRAGNFTPPVPPIDPAAVVRAAIEAHGGAEALRAVTMLHVQSRLDCGGISYASELHLGGADRFRQVVDAGDALMTHGCSGVTTFALLDDLPVELSDAEQRELVQQPQFMRPDLLLALLEPARFALREEDGASAGLREINVRATARKGDTDLLLHFAPDTHRLVAMTRKDGSAPRTLSFSDWRPVRGVLMPWCARWLDPGPLHVVNTFVRVETPTSLPEALFSAPPSLSVARPPVRGTSPATLALRVACTDWEEGREALEQHLSATRLQRSGPFSGEIVDGKLASMTLPIAARPDFEPAGPLLETAVALVDRAAQPHVRRAVRANGFKEALAALLPFAAEARKPGLHATTLRVVQWNQKHWILQLGMEH